MERKRLGWSQRELAEKSGVGPNFVYQLEKNKKSVQLDSTNQVLRALGYKVGVMRDFSPWGSVTESSKVEPHECPAAGLS